MHRCHPLRATLLCAVLLTSASSALAEPEPEPETAHLRAAVAYAAGQMHNGGVPGFAIGVVEGPHVIFARGYGRADQSGRPVNVDTPFILGSTSKSFTALCVLQLVDAGRVDLDAPVEQYLPSFMRGDAAGRAITVRMLLNQTSGVSHEAGDQPVLSRAQLGPGAIRERALSLTVGALNRPVGSRYEYSNANYVVLGAIIEAASGETYAHYLRSHVFEPLGMNHSYTSVEDARGNGLAQGHREWVRWFEASDVPYPPSFVPVGFITTSVADMTRYLAMEANGGELDGVRLVSEAGFTEMHRGVAPMDQEGKSRYAMGWVTDTFNGVPVSYHDGDTGRFTSIIAISNDRFGVVILANGSGWLSGLHLTDAANGAINILVGNTPKSYATPYLITTTLFSVLLVAPLLQLFFAVKACFRKKRRSAILGYWLPTIVNLGLATLFAYVVPRVFLGIPLSELVVSIPDIGLGALASVTSACLWLALSAMRLIRVRVAGMVST